MTDRNTAFNRSSRADSNTIPWANVSGETIPAFGVIQLRDNFSVVSQGKKPNSKTGLFFTNGPVSVATGGRGESRLWNKPQSVSVEATVTVGEEIGPTSGSWKMSSAGSGFRVLRQDTDEVAIVERVGGSGGGTGIHGIVRKKLGHGFYRVELSEWSGTFPLASDEADCDACVQFIPPAYGLGNCEAGAMPSFVLQTTPKTPQEFVIAYDPESTIVPLQIGTDCLMLDTGATSDPVDWGASFDPCDADTTAGDPVKVYQVVRGHQTHTVQYKDTYECCNGVDTLVGRQAIYFAALVCDDNLCYECPPPA